jgi:hypothetical protein
LAGFARHSHGNVTFSPSTFVMLLGGVTITADPEKKQNFSKISLLFKHLVLYTYLFSGTDIYSPFLHL